MKESLFSSIDLDSYIGIIIGIIILVISGLGSARKRKAQQASAPQAASHSDETDEDETEPYDSGQVVAEPVRDAQNPLETLEYLLTGRQSFTNYNKPQFVDEEEDIVQENPQDSKIEMDPREKMISTIETTKNGTDSPVLDGIKVETDISQNKLNLNELFADMDEIKRAVIYSEIFNRKYT